VEHWSDVATVWAKVVATSGNEQINQAIGVATTMYAITIREREDIDTSMRVLYEGATLQIRAVLSSDERGAGTLLDCREVVR
jgi:SPP1 family predicted phage head-tail adaptor